MRSVAQLFTHMQHFIHPIRATLFGGNVAPIMPGMSRPRQTVEFAGSIMTYGASRRIGAYLSNSGEGAPRP